MKKKTVIFLIAICIIIATTICLIGVFSIQNTSHVHEFGNWYTIKRANATQAGLEERVCSCGEFQRREIAPLGYIGQEIYVNLFTEESGDGSAENPFSNITEARDFIRTMDKSDLVQITVYIEAGEYKENGLTFTHEDSGTENCRIVYYAQGGDVKINGGISLAINDFEEASTYPEIYERLPAVSKENVIVLDLSKEPYNMTLLDYGNIYPIGTYNTASRYQGDTTGDMFCELFANGKRQTLARYPDEGYIYTGTPISAGRDSSLIDENGDPLGDVYKIDSALASRIAAWKSIEEVWTFGFWQYDWADGSTLLENFDASTNQLSMKYQSFFGIKEGAPYYFYNCLEELSCEGEWYLDRENGLLCYYPPSNFEEVDLTLSTSLSPIVTVNASYLSFNGFNLCGTRGNGVVINGSNVTVENCIVSGVGGVGIIADGSNIQILSNTVSNTGRGGIAVSGGDSKALTPSNNTVYNNLVCDWSQIYKTYQAGISLYGVGNICSHNELYNSPHLAITYSGNNNIIEYNLIHDVCKETDDAGAIYAGRSWSSYGNHIRYNCVYDIGSDGHTPDGIYMDDAISGQNIYGNILIDIPKFAIHIGGGRDMNVYGNLIINPGEEGIRYDARARQGFISETWFSEHVNENGDLWQDLLYSPWQTELWQNAFPQYKDISTDPSDIESADFMANPAGSRVSENIVFSKFASIGRIDDEVKKFSTVKNNSGNLSLLIKNTFGQVNSEEYTKVYGKYLAKKVEYFKNIDFGSIGRIE